jgi:hypothetical protein
MSTGIVLNHFTDHFEILLAEFRLEEAAQLIFQAAHSIFATTQFRGVCIRLPDLDKAAVRLADIMKLEYSAPKHENTNHVCLVTEVYNTGGHRTILNSVCEELPCHVIFTDLFGRLGHSDANLQRLVSSNAHVTTLPKSNGFLEKIKAAVDLLNLLSPKKVWILVHHEDIVGLLAALIFDSGKRSIFVHHCDHDPALGATIKFPVHLDFTTEVFKDCDSLGLQPSMLALYKKDLSRRATSPSNGVVVATAGSLHKFTGNVRGIQYPDIVKIVLQHPRVDSFHHIGEISEQQIATIATTLEQNGIDSRRMIFPGYVKSVSDYLLSMGVSVFVSSFPIGAGATTAEVQSAGIPVVYFNPSFQDKKFLAIRSIYASTDLEWSAPSELKSVLDRLIKSWSMYSDAAYQMFLETASREVFIKQLAPLR